MKRRLFQGVLVRPALTSGSSGPPAALARQRPPVGHLLLGAPERGRSPGFVIFSALKRACRLTLLSSPERGRSPGFSLLDLCSAL